MKSARYPLTHQSALIAFTHIKKSIQINSKEQDINFWGLISQEHVKSTCTKKRLTVQPTYWTGQITESILQLSSQYKLGMDWI